GEKVLFARGNCFPLQIDQFYLVHLSGKPVAAQGERERASDPALQAPGDRPIRVLGAPGDQGTDPPGLPARRS
ncbi:hypothetical protein, partial [Micromonospora sp. NPDC006431]|uniref:hypothetical protein n=1 Tax=Micromonospora sp. NPDC006431 TaxID=3364235 RepID=UPI0036B6206B